MRNYIILNGVNSNTITGLLISTLPPITKPKQRTQTEEIDGRDGDIVTKLGYSAYDKEIEIGLYGDFDIDDVIAYFNSEGTVTFSNEPDKFYNYQIIDQIDYEKLIRFKTAKVKMHVQPFKYPLEETPVEINIQNVTGSGETISLDNTAEAPVTLALKGNTSQNGTPTPTTPVEVNTVTGGQVVSVCGKNLLNIEDIVKGRLDSGVIGYESNTTALTLNNNSFAFTTNANNRGVTTDYIGVESGSYTISSDNLNSTYGLKVACYDSTKIWFQDATFTGNASEKRRIITIPSGTSFIRIYFSLSSAGSITITNPQVEEGNTPSTYEEYKGNDYEINLGKNLANINDIQIGKTWSGTANNNRATILWIPVIEGQTYSLVSSYTNENITQIRGILNKGASDQTSNLTVNGTFTVGSGWTHISIEILANTTFTQEMLDGIKIMLCKGTATIDDYAPYKTPIELCKIGDYQDRIYKNNSKWYLYKEIDKVVLNGTQTISKSASGTQYNVNRYYFSFTNKNDTGRNLILSNRFNVLTSSTQYNSNTSGIFGGSASETNRIYFQFDSSYTDIDTIAKVNAWFENNNTSVYSVIETPTTTEITDNTLIGQLNALENARSYDPTTNISQNTPNKPFIIDATAVQKGSDTGIVDNIGNIYAKPTIDIEGSGIVEIYLDGNQIFNVDLSTINECVIDTTNLEAYNPATTQLMNRQVTGDYSNFKINVGDNQVKVSGAVTKATISNYTRWL